jgi:hypothetical protein
LVGPVFQEGDQGRDLVHDVEDVAAAGDVGQRQLLAGLQAAAAVANDGCGNSTHRFATNDAPWCQRIVSLSARSNRLRPRVR